MRVFLDDQPLTVVPPTIANALDVARDRAEAARRIVIEAQADGRPLEGQLLDHPPADNAGFAELRFISAPTGAFVSETLREAADLLPGAVEDQRAATEALQRGDHPAAAAALQTALTAWSTARDVVEKSGILLGLDPARLEFLHDGAPLRGDRVIEDLRACLEQVRTAITDADWTRVADTLGYDLADIAPPWRAFMIALADHARHS